MARPDLALPKLIVVVLGLMAGIAGARADDPFAGIERAVRLRDYQGAARQLETLAKAGNAEADFRLATFLRAGRGVARDDVAAFRHMERAATAGHAEAALGVAKAYASGIGVKKDGAAARRWLAIAHERGADGGSELAAAIKDDPAPRAAAPAVQAMVAPVTSSQLFAERAFTPLMEAASRRQTGVVRAILAGKDSQIDAIDTGGRTALAHAVAAGATESARALLESGADVRVRDATGLSVLMLAAQSSGGDICADLLQHGADADERGPSGLPPLATAVASGNEVCALALLDAGANPGSEAEASALLIEAATRTSPALVERLSALGALDATDDEGCTAIWESAFAGRNDVVALLIDKGAAIDLANAAGESPLVAAVKNGQTIAARRLLAAGADPDLRTRDGNFALLIAAGLGLEDVVGALVEAGADIDQRNMRGNTALMMAAARGHAGVVRILVAANVKIGLRNDKRERAADIARAAGHPEIAAMMD